MCVSVSLSHLDVPRASHSMARNTQTCLFTTCQLHGTGGRRSCHILWHTPRRQMCGRFSCQALQSPSLCCLYSRDRYTCRTGSSAQLGDRNQGCSLSHLLSHYVFYLSSTRFMEVKVSSVINWDVFDSQRRLGDGSASPEYPRLKLITRSFDVKGNWAKFTLTRQLKQWVSG